MFNGIFIDHSAFDPTWNNFKFQPKLQQSCNLEHFPHGPDVILGVAPVSQRVQISELKAFELAQLDFGN